MVAAVRPAPVASPPTVVRSPATRQVHRTGSVRTRGRLRTVPGHSEVLGSGPLKRFKVQTEEGLVPDQAGYAAAFAALVHRTLADPRGWGHGGRMSFQRVSHGPVDFTVVLAGPATTDRLCRPLRTNGIFSCYDSRGRAVINFRRWRDGARPYRGHLVQYRQYVINHEVGHALGHGHAQGCRPDGRAQTMLQQTKSLSGCARNAWPYP